MAVFQSSLQLFAYLSFLVVAVEGYPRTTPAPISTVLERRGPETWTLYTADGTSWTYATPCATIATITTQGSYFGCRATNVSASTPVNTCHPCTKSAYPYCDVRYIYADLDDVYPITGYGCADRPDFRWYMYLRTTHTSTSRIPTTTPYIPTTTTSSSSSHTTTTTSSTSTSRETPIGSGGGSSSGDMSQSNKIALGVGIGIGVPTFLVGLIGLWIKCIR